MTSRIRLSATASDDIRAILEWSATHFEAQTATRYAALIETALHDIGEDPMRPGSSRRQQAGPGARAWHLRSSRDRARRAGAEVASPRHFLLYRVEGSIVSVGRVLHDARDVERHVANDEIWT